MGFLQLLAAIIHMFSDLGAHHAHLLGGAHSLLDGRGVVETRHWIITIRPR